MPQVAGLSAALPTAGLPQVAGLPRVALPLGGAVAAAVPRVEGPTYTGQVVDYNEEIGRTADFLGEDVYCKMSGMVDGFRGYFKQFHHFQIFCWLKPGEGFSTQNLLLFFSGFSSRIEVLASLSARKLKRSMDTWSMERFQRSLFQKSWVPRQVGFWQKTLQKTAVVWHKGKPKCFPKFFEPEERTSFCSEAA